MADQERQAALIEAAVAYAGRGLPVFPCNGKVPLTEHGFLDATTDPETVLAWWKLWPMANIAMPTGTASGTDAIDIDVTHGGAGTLAELERRHGKLPATLEVLTPSDGEHLWFAHDRALRSTAGTLGVGLDTRGEGGYIILPPSVGENGRLYRFLAKRKRAELPAWVFELLDGRKRRNGSAPPVEAVIPEGERRQELLSLAGTLRHRGLGAEEILTTLETVNEKRCRPPLERVEPEALAGDVARRYEPAVALGTASQAPVEARLAELRTAAGAPTVADVLAAVRRYMKVSASEAVYLAVALATATARNLVDEEPLWVMLVGASGGGKTEAIRLCKTAADEGVDELTRAGLLSWSPGKKPRRSGLLTRVPNVAFVTISDFSTVVTMGDREARARMFGALRVIYDGRIYRSIGGQPAEAGHTLDWEGHLTLLVGATPVVDTHFSFETALGERWLLFRIPEAADHRARERARFTVDRGQVSTHRQRAQELAATLVHHARGRVPEHLSDESKSRLVDAAFFCAHARTGVPFEGTGRYRMPIGYPMPEEPMRLAGQLHRLGRCLVALGIDERLAVAIAVQAAFDSIPLARLKAIRHVADESAATVASTHRAIGRGNRWSTKWELTALEAIGMVDVEGPDESEDATATRVYALAERYKGVYDSVASFFISLSIEDETESERGEQATQSYTPGAA